jgi:hypothetical protein
VGGLQTQRKAFCFQQKFFYAPNLLKQAWQILRIKKPDFVGLFFVFGGERGIRTPGPLTVNGFQDRRIQPLCHLSL